MGSVARSPEEGKSAPKRLKSSQACQACRTKKLACDGSRPCARCRQDRRDCAEAASSERTPLTRKRMTELEDELKLHRELWSELCPAFFSHAVVESAATEGVSTTVRLVLDHLRGDSGNVNQRSPHGALVALTSFQVQAPIASQPKHPTSDYHDANLYPRTRSTSPRHISLQNAYELPTTTQPGSAEWHEELNSPHRNLGALDGMGATVGTDPATHQCTGAGYTGLSSGATLLHVIKRLLPVDDTPSLLTDWLWLQPPESSVFPSGKTAHPLSTDDSFLRSHSFDEDCPRFPASETRPLVDSYFRYFHALTPLLHEPTVRAQLSGALHLPRGSGSTVLTYMIYAMGAFDIVEKEDDDVSHKYYQVARYAVQRDFMEEGSTQLVQGLAIMANYLQRRNRPNAGYVCLGLAIRMALALGIHTAATSEKLSPLEREVRIRLWWGLVTLEAGCSSTFGRPPGITPAMTTIPFPINCDDEDLTVSSQKKPPDGDRPTLYTPLLTQARLAQKFFGLHDRISRSLPFPTVEQIKWCGDAFRDEVLSFPGFMHSGDLRKHDLSRAVQSWRARDQRSILYRPVLLSAAWSRGDGSEGAASDIVDTCRSLAMENLRDIGNFVRSEADQRRGSQWYTLYFGFQASLTLLLSILWQPNHPSACEWRNAVQEATTWFSQLGSVQTMCSTYLKIMLNVLEAKLESPAMMQTGVHNFVQIPQANEESDQTAFDFDKYLEEIWSEQSRGLTDPVNQFSSGAGQTLFNAEQWTSL